MHEPWSNNSIVALKWVGSMTTKGQVKKIFRKGLIVSQD